MHLDFALWQTILQRILADGGTGDTVMKMAGIVALRIVHHAQGG